MHVYITAIINTLSFSIIFIATLIPPPYGANKVQLNVMGIQCVLLNNFTNVFRKHIHVTTATPSSATRGFKINLIASRRLLLSMDL